MLAFGVILSDMLNKAVQKIALILVIAVTADAVTTFWVVHYGFGVERNPLIAPIAHTLWLFPAMILPAVGFAVLAIWLSKRFVAISFLSLCVAVVWALCSFFLATNNVLVATMQFSLLRAIGI